MKKIEQFYHFSGFAYFKCTTTVKAIETINQLPGALIIKSLEMREDADEVAIHFENIQSLKVSQISSERKFIDSLKEHVRLHTKEVYSSGMHKVNGPEFEIDNYTLKII